MGYDVHKLVKERRLILGGVEIYHEFGLLGHSDADVLLHAVMDAMLGALALGDIGTHFPDDDEKYRGIASTQLLENVYALIKKKGYHIGNLDAVIVAQKPKLKEYIGLMRKNIAELLDAPLDRISVKATTEEGLGFTGKREGISCYCVCLLEEEG